MKPLSELSQQQKIMYVLVRDDSGRWFFPYDFMKSDMGDLFVGYEASARLSELGKEYPEIIESQRDGKYIKRRIIPGRLLPNLHLLSKDLRYIVHRSGLTKDYKPPTTEKPLVKPASPTITKQARYIGRNYRLERLLVKNEVYPIAIGKLQMHNPIEVSVKGTMLSYPNAKEMLKDWRMV